MLLIENLLLRERFDWQTWDLRQMNLNVLQMKKIAEKATWSAMEKKLGADLIAALGELHKIVVEKDATRVIAGHTHVEQALSSLRDIVFSL